MSGIEMIAAERQKQIKNQGIGNTTDSYYVRSELLFAAQAYLGHGVQSEGYCKAIWPWEENSFKPGTTLRNLVKAGALIAAEVDRLLELEK